LRAVIVELNGSGRVYGYGDDTVFDIMSKHGFRAYRYEPASRSLVALTGRNLESNNTLFVRDESFVMARLENAPPASLQGSPLLH
jgi:hypothetical protein